MQLEKQGVDWTFAQQLQFNDLGKGNLFKSLPSLDLINGKVHVDEKSYQISNPYKEDQYTYFCITLN